jgi:hypothetical protein
MFGIDYHLMTTGVHEGVAVVFDMTGVTLGHVARLNLMAIKKFLNYLQDGINLRLKEFHWVNTVPFLDKIMMMIKPFMKKELIDILHFHTGMETLYPFVPQNVLTSEYGGQAGDSKELNGKQAKLSMLFHGLNFFVKFLERFWDDVFACKDFYLEDERVKKVDEKKRVGKSKYSDDAYGMDGNFKRLDID